MKPDPERIAALLDNRHQRGAAVFDEVCARCDRVAPERGSAFCEQCRAWMRGDPV